MRTLTLHVPGATAEELARGRAAAQAFFDAHGVEPEEAAIGHHLREAWEIGGRQIEDSPTEAELRAAQLWDDARAVAGTACCIDWTLPPSSAMLGLKEEAEPTAPE